MKKLCLALVLMVLQSAAWAIVVTSTASIAIRAGDGSVNVQVDGDGSVRVLPGDGSVRFLAGDGSVRVTSQGDIVTWSMPDFVLSDANGDVASFSNFTFSYDTDPFIAFGVSVVNFTSSPQNFAFVFGSPYVGGPYDSISSQLQLDGADESEVPAVAVTNIVHESRVDGTLQLSPAIADCGPSGSVCSTGATGSMLLSPASNAAGFFTSGLSFTASGGDTVVVAGRTDLFNAGSNVPEPGAMALALLGLAGLAGLKARRRGRLGAAMGRLG